MTSEHCPDHNLLAAFSDGRLTGSERERVIQHVNGCERCFALYRDALIYAGRTRKKNRRFAAFSKPGLTTGMMMAAALLVLFLGLYWFSGEDQPWRQAQWWSDRYAVMPATDPTALKTRAVFERVRAAVPGAARAELFLVEGAETAIALALPAQGVVLSRAAINRCYQTGEPNAGDARLALVLGHELAHFRAGDELHAFAAFQTARDRDPNPRIPTETLHEKEIHADQWGMVYAAQAGFDPALLLRDGEDFFREWVVDAVPAAAYASHPDPAARADFLMDALTEVAADLDYFYYGLRFYQMGRHAEARDLFNHFRGQYEGREVLNNLGLVALQLALQNLAACDGAPVIRFRLPLMIDSKTLVESARLRGAGLDSPCSQDPIFRERLQTATTLFQQALARDPSYAPALFNLLSTRIVAGETSAAMALASELKTLLPDSITAQGAHALALYLFAVEKDLAEDRAEAVAMIRGLLLENPLPDLAYNLAVMEDETGQPAEGAWRYFLTLEERGPYAAAARARLGLPDPPPMSLALDLDPPLPLGPIKARARSILEPLSRRVLAGTPTRTAWRNGSLRVLTEADQVLFVEHRLAQPLDLNDLSPQWRSAPSVLTSQGRCLIGDGLILETVDGSVVKYIWFAL